MESISEVNCSPDSFKESIDRRTKQIIWWNCKGRHQSGCNWVGERYMTETLGYHLHILMSFKKIVQLGSSIVHVLPPLFHWTGLYLWSNEVNSDGTIWYPDLMQDEKWFILFIIFPFMIGTVCFCQWVDIIPSTHSLKRNVGVITLWLLFTLFEPVPNPFNTFCSQTITWASVSILTDSIPATESPKRKAGTITGWFHVHSTLLRSHSHDEMQE